VCFHDLILCPLHTLPQESKFELKDDFEFGYELLDTNEFDFKDGEDALLEDSLEKVAGMVVVTSPAKQAPAQAGPSSLRSNGEGGAYQQQEDAPRTPTQVPTHAPVLVQPIARPHNTQASENAPEVDPATLSGDDLQRYKHLVGVGGLCVCVRVCVSVCRYLCVSFQTAHWLYPPSLPHTHTHILTRIHAGGFARARACSGHAGYPAQSRQLDVRRLCAAEKEPPGGRPTRAQGEQESHTHTRARAEWGEGKETEVFKRPREPVSTFFL
jgi:hypothetical protein